MFGSRSVKPDIPARTFGSRVRLWSTPEGSEESIATIVRYGDPIDSAVPEVVLDFGSGRTPASIERDDLRKIHLGEPEIAKFGRLDGQDHEAIRHSLHFVETAAPIGPVVQREHRERGIKRLRSEGESLSRRLDYKRCLTRSLPDHVPRWFNGYQEPADRFVGASASSDVDHRVGIAECIQNRGADPGIRMPCRCVPPSNLVVHRVSHPMNRCPPTSARQTRRPDDRAGRLWLQALVRLHR